MYPGITCMCPTFGRPQRILEEAVYSFLQQDYPGEKELLILNDFAAHTIVFEHPQVTIVNRADRFPTLGEKRNAVVALSRYDLLAVWDDDDISLSHRLSFSVSQLGEKGRYFKPARAFMWNDGVVSGPRANRFHASGMWRRSLFEQAGGYPAMGSGEDQGIEDKFKTLLGPGMNFDSILPSEVYYLYRWYGTGSYHLSSYGRDREGSSGHDRVARYALAQLKTGEIQSGEIHLRPQWSVDYAQMVKNHVAVLERERSAAASADL